MLIGPGAYGWKDRLPARHPFQSSAQRWNFVYLRAFYGCMLGVMPLALTERTDKPLNDWLCRLATDRPVYDCLKCEELAMQFFAQRLDLPGREDFFYCSDLRLSWLARLRPAMAQTFHHLGLTGRKCQSSRGTLISAEAPRIRRTVD